MANILTYPAILHPEETSYTVEVPDIENGFTQGEDLQDAIEMAADMIGLMLEDLTNYPDASNLEGLVVADGDVKTSINVDMDEYHRSNSKKI